VFKEWIDTERKRWNLAYLEDIKKDSKKYIINRIKEEARDKAAKVVKAEYRKEIEEDIRKELTPIIRNDLI